MTHFEEIKNMSIDELAEYFAGQTFPSSPCYVCEHDRGMGCVCRFKCDEEYWAMLYRDWLNRERNDYGYY